MRRILRRHCRRKWIGTNVLLPLLALFLCANRAVKVVTQQRAICQRKARQETDQDQPRTDGKRARKKQEEESTRKEKDRVGQSGAQTSSGTVDRAGHDTEWQSRGEDDRAGQIRAELDRMGETRTGSASTG